MRMFAFTPVISVAGDQQTSCLFTSNTSFEIILTRQSAQHCFLTPRMSPLYLIGAEVAEERRVVIVGLDGGDADPDVEYVDRLLHLLLHLRTQQQTFVRTLEIATSQVVWGIRLRATQWPHWRCGAGLRAARTYLVVLVGEAGVDDVGRVGRRRKHVDDGREAARELVERRECGHDAHALTVRQVLGDLDARDVLAQTRHAPERRLHVLQPVNQPGYERACAAHAKTTRTDNHPNCGVLAKFVPNH